MRPVLNPGELARYADMIVTGCLDFRRGEDLVIRAEPEHREAGSGAPAPRARAPRAPARCSHPPRAAAAYDGAIRYVDTGDFLQAGAQIATVEARHAAYFNLINRASPFPDAFETGKKPSDIVTAVLATGFVKSCPQVVLDLFARLKAAGA